MVLTFSHVYRTLKHFPDGTFDTTSGGVTLLLNQGIPRRELLCLGQQAAARGAVLDRGRGTCDVLQNGVLVNCLRPLTRSWHLVDGTIPWSEKDEAARLLKGPTWHRNSCAIDSVAIVALLLNGGRCQVDQMTQSDYQKLPQPARLMLRIIRLPWASLSTTQMNRLRDLLCHSLTELDSTLFTTNGMMGIYDVAAKLLAGLPQLHLTTTTMYSCSGHDVEPLFKVVKDKTCHRATRLGLTCDMSLVSLILERLTGKNTLQNIINGIMGSLPVNDIEESRLGMCPHPRCRGRVKQTMVLDHLPPVLMLAEGWGTTPVFSDQFQPVIVTYRGLDGIQTVEYEPLGCVVANGLHFWVQWNLCNADGSNRAIRYDGMADDGRFTEIMSLENSIQGDITKEFSKQSQVPLMFYRMKHDNMS